jgi:hypothetical protein
VGEGDGGGVVSLGALWGLCDVDGLAANQAQSEDFSMLFGIMSPDFTVGGSASSNIPLGNQTGHTFTGGAGGGVAYSMGGTHIIFSSIPICPAK